MKNNNKKTIALFLSNKNDYPILAGLTAGLYPIFFYFSNNYTLINTWGHVAYFVFFFLIVPALVFFIAHKIFKLSRFAKLRKYVLPFLNMFTFLFLLIVCLCAGIQPVLMFLAFAFAALFAFFLYKDFKKVMAFQLILAVLGLIWLIPNLIAQINYSKAWQEQPDAIENAVFKKKPNVYFIQPDGYANFSELKKGHYDYDNSAFEGFLKEEGFKNYPGFRSNYTSTLSSNSSVFMMKHHYYNNGSAFNEPINARNVIISENPVLNIFENNGYKTHFISELPYLLINRPAMGYDFCNFDYDRLSYISTGLGERQDILKPLADNLKTAWETPKFFFIEIFDPGHISSTSAGTDGAQEERTEWLQGLERANDLLRETVTLIKSRDPNGLIIIMADHGGYVGFDYTDQKQEKTQDETLIHSMFSANLSIHWPNGMVPVFDGSFVSSVNFFRILFAYLSENQSYLSHLQDNSSYITIYKDAPKGIYKYIDDSGNITFEKL